MDVMPIYEAPALRDASKAEALPGPLEVTPCWVRIPVTVEWQAGR